MTKLNKLAINHPYYCSDSNFYSNEPGADWETMTDFLEEYEDADIDMNLMFRWDIFNRSETKQGNQYRADIFIIQQRKGIFSPHRIEHINQEEVTRFEKYAKKHWLRLCEIWNPLNTTGNKS